MQQSSRFEVHHYKISDQINLRSDKIKSQQKGYVQAMRREGTRSRRHARPRRGGILCRTGVTASRWPPPTDWATRQRLFRRPSSSTRLPRSSLTWRTPLLRATPASPSPSTPPTADPASTAPSAGASISFISSVYFYTGIPARVSGVRILPQGARERELDPTGNDSWKGWTGRISFKTWAWATPCQQISH